MRKNEDLKQFRPSIHVEKQESNELELFQNQVLRPILKYQHDLLVIEIQTNPIVQKLLGKEISDERKRNQLKVFFSKSEIKFQLLGQISGMLTNQEFQFYKSQKKDIDKRIFAMLLDRILSIELINF